MASPPRLDSVPELLKELERTLHATTSLIGSDLERLRMVIRDATAKLTQSFRGLQVVLVEHREMLTTIASALHNPEAGGQSFARSADALTRQFVDEMVRVGRDSMVIIDQLASLADQVDGIVLCADGIDRLARETRFIAFNARIETHRAGDSGRTFKVVADEVKRLATASSELSGQIRQCIGQCRIQMKGLGQSAEGLASHDMGAAIASHRGLAVAITKMDEVNQSLESMLTRVEGHVSEAVRALQYEDMVSQLVTGSIKRIEGSARLMTRALWAMDQTNGERSAALRDVLDEFAKINGASHVQQESVTAGSIELF